MSKYPKPSSELQHLSPEEVQRQMKKWTERQIEKLANPQKHEVKNMEYGVTYCSQMSDKYFFTESKPESPESIESFRLIWNSISDETKAKLFDINQVSDKTDTETLGAAHQADIDYI